MVILDVKEVGQLYGFAKDISKLFGYKDPTKLLKDFRKYADENKSAFHPYKPYIKNQGMDNLYSIVCFAFYFENRDLLEAGTRSITFKKELPRLRKVYESCWKNIKQVNS